MKILYVANRYSPLRVQDGSGTDYDLYHALLEQGGTVQVVGPFAEVCGLIERGYRKLHGLFSRQRYAKHSLAYLAASAREVERAIGEYEPQVIFGFFGAPFVRLRTQVPLVYMLDTTLIGAQQQRPLFSWIEYQRMLAWEREVVGRSAHVITCSRWSAEFLQRDYGLPAERITVLPIPASLPVTAIPRELDFESPQFRPLRLLLVGRIYQLKGIDIAIEVVEQLNQAGIPAELRIVGLSGEDRPHVQFTRLYDKVQPADLAEYTSHYQWAHFLIHPARYEAAGIVASEAAAFGVPTLTNAAGGLATTVEDQVSGIVLPKGSPAEAYVAVLQGWLDVPQAYLELRQSTRQRFERELNWQAAGKRLLAIMEKVVI
jgi:glycosyltransferase involved in cell wall biosynthesis